MKQRGGFTLVEVLGVVIVLAVIAAAVSVTLAASARRSAFRSALDEVAFLDHTARRAALRLGRAQSLTFDAAAQTITRPSAGDDAERVFGSTLAVSGARMVELRTADGVTDRAEIRYTTHGHAPTYAVHFTSADESQWLVMVGLTGQALTVATEDEVDRIFATFRGETR